MTEDNNVYKTIKKEVEIENIIVVFDYVKS